MSTILREIPQIDDDTVGTTLGRRSIPHLEFKNFTVTHGIVGSIPNNHL
jgi:hypothetical protein